MKFRILIVVLCGSLMALAAPALAITNGTIETGYPAVGALVETSSSTVVCTATLVHDGWMVTAADCLFNAQGEVRAANELHVCFGNDVTNDCERFDVDHRDVHPNFDGTSAALAMVHLEGDLTNRETVDLNETSGILMGGLPFSWVGFGGVDEAGTGEGIKRSVSMFVDFIDATTFMNSTISSPCKADIGAPAIADVSGTPAVVGVITAGDEICAFTVTSTRVDTYLAWIQTTIDNNTPCDLLGGTCEAGTACFPTTDSTQCMPTDDINIGASCDPQAVDQLQCEDGGICLQGVTNTEGTCQPFCNADEDCIQVDHSCAPVFTDRTDVGVCQCVDADDDGSCARLDCDDEDATSYPGAQEVCGNNVDEDCSGTPDDAPECANADMGPSPVDPDMGTGPVTPDMGSPRDIVDGPGSGCCSTFSSQSDNPWILSALLLLMVAFSRSKRREA